MKRNVYINKIPIALLVLTLILSSCGNLFDNTPYEEPAGIKLVFNNMHLFRGDSYEMQVKFDPEEVPDQSVYWYSSNEACVSVNNGVITAVKEGEAMIHAIATAGMKKDSCQIKVYKPWQEFDSYKFEHDMVIYATITLNGKSANELTPIVAMCNEETRGIPVYMEAFGKKYFEFRIYSNQLSGEKIIISGYDTENFVVCESKMEIDFMADVVEGTLSNLYEINL